MDGHTARKRFGQNFLADRTTSRRSSPPSTRSPGDNLVEIGPGLGALTGPLLERRRTDHRDRDRPRPRGAPRASASRRTGWRCTSPTRCCSTSRRWGRRCASSATCPTTSARRSCSTSRGYDAQIVDLHVMLQREVVARMTAEPATADYGRLTVMLQAKFAVRRLFVVPAGAFSPAPKVESAVARLTPLGAAEAGHRRRGAVRRRGPARVRPAAQDAAQRAVGARDGGAARGRRHRPVGARRDAGGR